MEDLLIETLETFGYPVRLQGSFLENEPYPPHFFTFWNRNSNSDAYYDNDENSLIYEYDVNFYSINPDEVYEKIRLAKAMLKRKGFIISGDGYSVASDELTHTGRGLEVKFLKF